MNVGLKNNIIRYLDVCSSCFFNCLTSHWSDHYVILLLYLNSYLACSIKSCRRFKNIITSFVLIWLQNTSFVSESLPALDIVMWEKCWLNFFHLDLHIFGCTSTHCWINSGATHEISLLWFCKRWWAYILFRWFTENWRVGRSAAYCVPGICKLTTPTTHEVRRWICTVVTRFGITMIGVYHLY